MAADEHFRRFGDKASFALDLCLAADQPDEGVPQESIGSWGAWRLWAADVNLCRLQLETDDGVVEVQEVRWFLAPLIRWLVANWMPLLHEARLPEAQGWGDRRPRWARLAYLAMLERAGDTDQFRQWQGWATRHALRSSAEGGIVPDIFFQRVGDEMEMSWGDRVQPGGEAVTFVVEDGVTRVAIDDVAPALIEALDWVFAQPAIGAATWSRDVAAKWRATEDHELGLEPLYWYLDGQSAPGPLATKLIGALGALGKELPVRPTPWMGQLAPEIAMFGDLTPTISQEASVILLSEYFNAQSDTAEPEQLARLVVDEPAWASTSPWENGYSLALDTLDDADPNHEAAWTDLDTMLVDLGITVRTVALDAEGPRGVAFAGEGLRPTILVNNDHPMNYGRGIRFTVAHEFCHILFDRSHARSLIHTSTPWAPPSVEQRANAFAAMLLMPTYRAQRPSGITLTSLSRGVSMLADRLGVSRIALRRHLANLGEISGYERDHMLGGRDPAERPNQ